jgi:hypothetical protein
MRSSASSFKFQYFHSFLRSSSRCLLLLQSSRPFYPSFSNLFHNAIGTKELTNPIAFLRLIVCRMSLSFLILCYTSSSFKLSVQLIEHHINNYSVSYSVLRISCQTLRNTTGLKLLMLPQVDITTLRSLL